MFSYIVVANSVNIFYLAFQKMMKILLLFFKVKNEHIKCKDFFRVFFSVHAYLIYRKNEMLQR